MSDRLLRSKLIRLAYARPEIRQDVLALLKSADQDDPANWYGLEPKKPGISDPAPAAKAACGTPKQG